MRRTLQERSCLQLPSYIIFNIVEPPTATLQLSSDGAFVNPDHGAGSRAEDASCSAPWNRFTLVSPHGPTEPRLWRPSSSSPGNNLFKLPLWGSWMALVPLCSFLEMSSSPLAVSQTALNPSPEEPSSCCPLNCSLQMTSQCWGRNEFLKAFGHTPLWKHFKSSLCRRTDTGGVGFGSDVLIVFRRRNRIVSDQNRISSSKLPSLSCLQKSWDKCSETKSTGAVRSSSSNHQGTNRTAVWFLNLNVKCLQCLFEMFICGLKCDLWTFLSSLRDTLEDLSPFLRRSAKTTSGI